MIAEFIKRHFARRNMVVILMAILWLAVSSTGTALAQTQPFLIQPYFGQEAITSIFDHEYPDYGANGTLVAYNGTRRGPPSAVGNCTNGINGSCYDGHDAIDFSMSYEPIIAAASGIVTAAGWQTGSRSGISSQLGLFVEIDHGNNYRTRYGHLSAIAVQVGNSIEKGQIIGASGNTGNSTQSHLHFGILRYVNGFWRATDPFGWGGGYSDPWQSLTGTSSNCLWMDGEWANYCGGLQRPIPQPRSNHIITIEDTINNANGFRKGYGGYLANPCVGVCGGWGEVVKSDQHSHYYTVQNTAGVINRWAEWRPVNLPNGGGVFEIRVRVPHPNATSWQAPYIIIHANGIANGRIDQEGLFDQWASLGIYRLNSDSYIRTHDFTGETSTHCSSGVCQVGIDAVEFRETGVVFAPDIRYRDGWGSKLALRNNGGGLSTTLVKFLDETGGVVCASTPTLFAHQSIEIACDSSNVASAVVNASQDVVAAVLQQRSSSSARGSYSGVEQPARVVDVSLVQNNNSGWQSELYIQNAGHATANTVTITFTSVNGAQCTRQENGIPPYGRRRVSMASLGCGAGTVLAAHVVGDQPLAVAVTQYNAGQTSFMETEYIATAATIYAPLIQNNNSGWSSSLNMLSPAGGTVTTSYYNPSGGIACTAPAYSVTAQRPYVVLPLPLGGTPCLNVLNARLSSGQFIAANVNQLKAGAYGASTYAALPWLSNVVAVARLRKGSDGWNDGLTISNPNSGGTTLTVVYYNQLGAVFTTQSYSLAGDGSISFNAPADFAGSALVLATKPVAVTVNHFIPTEGGDNLGSHTGRPR